MRLDWTPGALRDLRAAHRYIALDSPSAAARQSELIVLAALNLIRFPESGRTGRVAGTRELVVIKTPYLVAYRLHADTVEILRVFHGRRRWPGAL